MLRTLCKIFFVIWVIMLITTQDYPEDCKNKKEDVRSSVVNEDEEVKTVK